MIVAFVILYLLSYHFYADANVSAISDEKLTNIKATYLTSKERIIQAEKSERGVLSELYSINQKMKKMSRQRDQLTDRMLAASGNVKSTARDVAELEEKIKIQKGVLSKKLRALYKIRSSGILPVLFTAKSSHELDKTLKYLKAYSERDYELIRDHQTNLRKHNKKQKKLELEVLNLVKYKADLKSQEQKLEQEQNSKARILYKLEYTKSLELKRLKNVREYTKDLVKTHNELTIKELLDDSFFAMKGSLPLPVEGDLLRDYGIIQNPKFNYKLSHKGHFYKAAMGEPVKLVHNGAVSFVGSIPGYGKTVIVEHGDHYYTVYAFLNETHVKQDQVINKGDVIGQVGFNKIFKGEGLYFEIRHFSDSIDPKNWLVAKNEESN